MATETKKFRTWNITLNYDYEVHDENGNRTSDLTREEWKLKIQKIISFNCEDGWCSYIFHEKDILEDGLPKPLHVHILKNYKNARTKSSVMKMFNVSRDANCTNARSITSSARYLTHRTSQAMDDGKHQYNIDEVQTINCDYLELIKNKSDKTISQKEIDEIVIGLSIDIGNGRLYWLKAREILIDRFDEIEGTKLWNKHSRIFEKNFKEYLQNKAENYKLNGRNLLTFFTWGDSEVGKTWLSKCMCLLLSERIHMVPASGKNKTFDIAGMYDGENASLWNEVNGLELSNKEFLDRFDPKTYSPSNSRGKDKHCLSKYFFLTSTDDLEDVVSNLMPNELIEDFEIKKTKRHEINRRIPIEIKCVSLGNKKTEFIIRLYDSKNRDRFTLDSVVCENIENEKLMKNIAKKILTILGVLKKEKEDNE
ncbi:Rep family protein [Lactococcus lactis]|uniref:Replication protein n=1 Tax=Lactococcus lactis TaxID=1358 RepID=A0AB35KBR0_9LACT|nr:Rep family protein [Lactococcus lactis]MDG4978309.1 replication protein [Lactococcus lactis]MDG5048346.1 replication protein [Lactococcus lactis]